MLGTDHWLGMLHGITPFSFLNCSAPGYIQARPMLNADQSATSTSYGYDQNPAPNGVLCCRIIAITVSGRWKIRSTCFLFVGPGIFCTDEPIAHRHSHTLWLKVEEEEGRIERAHTQHKHQRWLKLCREDGKTEFSLFTKLQWEAIYTTLPI